MNGGPLPENPYLSYKPHNSFDENGVLKKEAWEAQDQEVTISPEEQEKSRLEEERRTMEREVAREISEDLTDEVIAIEMNDIAHDTVKNLTIEKLADDMRSKIEEDVVLNMLNEIVTETLRSARNKLIA